ncbi:hypothetical protein PAXRUDRAFT_7778 [Paxillus rubicundulus Ve08.2h10]|uniref:Uncharacterized protein n=1 Tax=Paxillus rubicundulus Ve08.2h10 TaxID=930991 RepID=A0A0D0EDE9_9AGAM|nr:hypothetical protein PAXRUDRAFT_7778 [Paxillus rubicundulus Ve08.2h10]
MILAAQPLPTDDRSSSDWFSPWRRAMEPHIYSPSDSHNSLSAMYSHPLSGSPSSSPRDKDVYSGYNPKESTLSAPRFNSWSTYSFLRSLSRPHSETTVNPKVTILPSQLLPASVDTPSSSTSSHSVLTPISPFTPYNVAESHVHDMEFDDFEHDDDDGDECIDSDFAERMEVVDEADQGQSPLYSAMMPHAIKSTSALEGALGESPASSYDTHLGAYPPIDRRMSASVPGYPSASRRPLAVLTHQPQRWNAKECSLVPMNSLPETSIAYPSQHVYTQHSHSYLTTLFAPTPSISLYHQLSPSSLLGAFTSARSSHPPRPSNPLPIMQPQPIRPIPPIPLAELTSSATEDSAPDLSGGIRSSRRLQALSPLPLLCQPVSDAVRYQLKEPSANGSLGGICCEENTSCEDLITVMGSNGFAHKGLAFSQERQSAAGTSPMEDRVCSCGCMGSAIGWQ